MRKLKRQMQITLDGMVSTGPNDEQKWVTPALNEIMPDVLDLLDSDTILIGRKLAIDYIPFWQSVFQAPEHQMYEIAKRIVAAQKVLFSQTLTQSSWDNTQIANGPVAETVNRLKHMPSKDLIVYGGRSFVSALIEADLIDEFYFFLNPIVIGQGESPFMNLQAFRRFELLSSKRYGSGIVLLRYQKQR